MGYMEYEVVKQWLDELVKANREANKENVLTSSIRAVAAVDTSVLVFSGIDIVADVMGLELQEELITHDSDFRYSYTFKYDGMRFVQYSSRRLTGYGDTE